MIHFVGHVLGLDNPSGPWYLFWSGISGTNLPGLAVFLLLWRKVNCHARGCYRVGLHRVAGTHYVTCAKHHPAHDGAAAAPVETIHEAYRAAQEDDPS